jgi:hypothetical protein
MIDQAKILPDEVPEDTAPLAPDANVQPEKEIFMADMFHLEGKNVFVCLRDGKTLVGRLHGFNGPLFYVGNSKQQHLVDVLSYREV